MTSPTELRFADFVFDPSTGELSGPGGPRRLQPQPAAVLTLLASRGGELVTREELQRRVWPDTKVEFDQGINYCIRQIRAALDESADAPRFIETLPRRGYRFLVPVEGARAPARRPKPAVRRASTWVVAAVLVVGGVVAARWIPAPNPNAAGVRVVVLPFRDFDSTATPLAAFNDALGDALVVELTAADGGRLRVVGPLTTGPLIRGGASAATIGTDLHADFVVSGWTRGVDSVAFVQAVRQVDGTHVVAKRFKVSDRTPEAVAADMAAVALGALRRPDAQGPGESPGSL